MTYPQPVELLQRLIRFDTTNPPGNERECVRYVDELLTGAGFETTILSQEPARANLVTRLPGRGDAPPLMLYGHADVVTTAHQEWTHPPFAGHLADGCVWGRGALDMKGPLTMMLAAVLRAKAEGWTPAGDVVLAILSDEEAGGISGAKYLVESHPEYFAGVRYALGEAGGFPVYVAGKKFYAIQVGEKQACPLRVTLRGPGGHASMPLRGGVMARLGSLLQELDNSRLPVHITPIVRQMLAILSAETPAPVGPMLGQMIDPSKTDAVLDQLGALGALFDAALHNTVTPTIVHGGEKVNVIPSQVTLELDARLLPGLTPEELLRELAELVGEETTFEVGPFYPGPGEPDMGLFETLASVLREADPEAMVIPFVLPGTTDARFFSRLNIQSYGFTPMKLPAGFNFIQLIHAAEERLPVEALEFGCDAMFRALQRYGG